MLREETHPKRCPGQGSGAQKKNNSKLKNFFLEFWSERRRNKTLSPNFQWSMMRTGQQVNVASYRPNKVNQSDSDKQPSVRILWPRLPAGVRNTLMRRGNVIPLISLPVLR